MAIRRVSDLPDLLTTYRTDFITDSGEDRLSNLGNCLLEVSYNHARNIYQSFSIKTTDLLSLLLDLDDKYVTVSTDQTIIGAKTFTNDNGLSIDIDNSTYTNYSGAIRGITETSAEIAQTLDNKDIVTSVKSIIDYLSAQYVPLEMLPPNILPMLCSLISPKSVTCYVDPFSGNDKNGTGELSAPFLTIPRAISRINKVRFIEDANAYIRLLNDYCDNNDALNLYDVRGKPKHIQIYHPDMTQQRNIFIEGYKYDKSTGTVAPCQRVLSIDIDNSKHIPDDAEYWFNIISFVVIILSGVFPVYFRTS